MSDELSTSAMKVQATLTALGLECPVSELPGSNSHRRRSGPGRGLHGRADR